MPEDTFFTKRYLESRLLARQRAEREFVDQNPDLIQLLAVSNEYLAGCMLNLSGKDFGQVPHGLYACDLIVSFTRTYFIAIDLIRQGELIEAAVLVRKQIELLARLHELSANNDLDAMIRKTPNVKSLTTKLRKLYSSYSEVAHSADPIHLQQLGRIEDERHIWTSVYPQYSENAAITFQHILLSLAEFHGWASPNLSEVFSEEEYSAFQESFVVFVNEYVRTYELPASRHA